MGLRLVDKSADYSAISVGHAGMFTSVTANLRGLFELRRNAAKARQNSAPANDLEAQIGAPTFAATNIVASAVDQVVFPHEPSNGGENSFAMVLQVKNGGAIATDIPFGRFNGNATLDGAVYFTHANRAVRFESTLFASQSGGAYTENGVAQITMASDGSLDGTWQLVVGTVKSASSVRLYWPSRQQVVSTALTASQFSFFRQGVTRGRLASLPLAGAAQGVAVAAYWDRELSSAEVNTFYSEIKRQTALYGLAVQ